MRVTEQWMRTLGASCPQGADDFFQMGGDSMRMIELLLAVSADFSISTGFDAFYSSPTLDTLVKIVMGALGSPSRPS